MPPSTGFRRSAWLLPIAFAARAWTDGVLPALLPALCIPALAPARAEAADGHAVIADAQRRNGFATWHDRKSDVAMRTVDEGGAGRTADATVYERTDPHGEHRTFIELTAPTNVRGTRMLHVAPRGRPDEYWFWFPSIRRVQHLAGNAAGSRHRDEIFSGTDMSYRDLELIVRVLQWDADTTDATAEEAACDGGRCTKVVLVPHGANEFPFGRYDLWFSADTLLLTRVDLCGGDGQVVETITCSGYRPIGAYQTPSSCVIAHAATKVRSEITIRDVVYDSALPNDLFTVAHVGEG